MKNTAIRHRKKTYGNGFDPITSKADIRAFIDWWNERSYFPVATGQSETDPTDHRIAA